MGFYKLGFNFIKISYLKINILILTNQTFNKFQPIFIFLFHILIKINDFNA